VNDFSINITIAPRNKAKVQIKAIPKSVLLIPFNTSSMKFIVAPVFKVYSDDKKTQAFFICQNL